MAVNDATKVLTEEDLARINSALEQLKVADDLIGMAKNAGIDVSQFEPRAATSKQQLVKIKNVFFPGR
jgi:hypothetical protein